MSVQLLFVKFLHYNGTTDFFIGLKNEIKTNNSSNAELIKVNKEICI